MFYIVFFVFLLSMQGIESGLVPIFFNMFMNDAFYFIQKCDFVNYADDDTLSRIESKMESLMECWKNDSEVTIEWFHNNFMEANTSKFQFMLLKSFTSKEDLPRHILMNTTRIERESHVKLFLVIIDDKLKCNKYIDVLCKIANRQMNVLCRFRNVFNIEEGELIHNTFILANLNYCLIVWHFCDTASICKNGENSGKSLTIFT